jgi:Fic family protein
MNISPLTENSIQQLHKELLQYSDKDEWHRGRYKKTSSQVEAFGPDGKCVGVVFETASAFETPLRMESLFCWAADSVSEKRMRPLLIISLFVVELLAIHPFQDGNGRLSRVLTNYLLFEIWLCLCTL